MNQPTTHPMTPTEGAIVNAAMQWFADFMRYGTRSHKRELELYHACVKHTEAVVKGTNAAIAKRKTAATRTKRRSK